MLAGIGVSIINRKLYAILRLRGNVILFRACSLLLAKLFYINHENKKHTASIAVGN